jgi:hypothetical protein
MNISNPALWVTSGAFVLAFLFGWVANRTQFCTMGAVSDVVNMGDFSRLRMWLLAIAVAMIGTQALHATGQIDLGKAIYLRPSVTWASHVVGGALFGFGMVLASGCASKTLVRIGGGSLKSMVVFLVMGLTAYMTLRGIFGVARVASIDRLSVDVGGPAALPQWLASVSGLAPRTAIAVVTTAVAGALLVYVFRDHAFRTSREGLVGGAVVGALAVATWYLSGHIGFGEDPQTLENTYFATNTRTIESLSFVAPAAYTLELFMLWSDASLRLTLGIATTLGVISGSLAYALGARQFRWEGFVNAEDTANHLLGGALMGVGGVLALGCTIGQGLSGLSTLALGSFLSFAAIVFGAVLGLKYQIWRMERMG